jgi:hypothetical protein
MFGLIGRMFRSSIEYLELFITYYGVPNSTSTNATSQFHRAFNRRATVDGRSNKRERGGKASMSSQHPTAFGCIRYSDATVFSCSIKVEHNNVSKWNSQ